MNSFDPKMFAETYAEQLAEVNRRMLDMRVPAQRIINNFFFDIGEPRLIGRHDKWEMLQAYLMGFEYEPVPKDLLERWLSY